MTGAERISLCYSTHLLTSEVKIERFREGLQGTERLLGDEDLNCDSLVRTSDKFCVIGSSRTHNAKMGQLLIPSLRTRTEQKSAARLKSNRKSMQQDVSKRIHRLKSAENY